MASKKLRASMNKNTFHGEIHNFLLPFPLFLPDDSAGMIARELWWTNQEFSSVDIIPSWFLMLVYHLADKQ
jgi:hypothetical protein